MSAKTSLVFNYVSVMQQTFIFSSTSRTFNKLPTVLVFSDLALASIEFKIKEVGLSLSPCKLWFALVL